MKKIFLMFLVVMFVFSCGSDDTTNGPNDTSDKECSQTNLNGTCKDGQSCINGECKIICSKDATDGYCDNGICIEGECKAECSKETPDGYCENDKTCMEGTCKYNMEGITLSVVNEDNKEAGRDITTDKDGNFEINIADLSGNNFLIYKNKDKNILSKYQGIINYSEIKITKRNTSFETSFDKVFTDKLDKDKKLISFNNKNKFSLIIKGKISVYECIPKKNLGEPVTGAEIYIAQDPNTEPLAKSKTGDDGKFCFGENCEGIKISLKTDKANNDKGGFAIGGYRLDKSKDNNKKGGFAIGGYRLDKNGDYMGYTITINNDSIKILTPILADTDKDNKFLINHFNLEKLSAEVPDTLLLKTESNLINWNYTCEK